MAEERKDRERSTFGHLLRFWRATFGMSQEELSWKVGVSSRHIGFLEVGRSQPTRQMVGNLAETFNLNTRDTNNLLVAAGFTSKHRPLDTIEEDFLHESLNITLRNNDPHPMVAMDTYANILMMNKAFLRLLKDNLEPEALQGPLNGYHILFGERGLRPYIQHWENLAYYHLITLQQEVILNEDPVAKELLKKLLDYPGIPEDWNRRSAELSANELPFKNSFSLRHGYQMVLNLNDQSVQNYLVMMSTVGSAPSINPRLLTYTMYPQGDTPYVSTEELARDASLKHPLLFY